MDLSLTSDPSTGCATLCETCVSQGKSVYHVHTSTDVFMKKYFLAFAFLALIVSPVFSQNVRPVPASTPPADNDVVRISTNLIQVDVTVTDSKGKPVTDLRPEEVEIFENG